MTEKTQEYRPIKRWMRKARKAEIRELAKLSRSSAGYLNQIANGWRNPSPELGGRLARAAESIRLATEESKIRLPVMTRGDLVPTCNECPFYKKCREAQAKMYQDK